MRNPHLPLFVVTLCAALLPGQSKQSLDAARSVTRLGPVPIHTAPEDPQGGTYGLWTATDSYKASFHGDMTFIPYLGDDYPENQSLSWRTESVRVGAHELLPSGRRPERWHTDLRCEYRFGTVTEIYDVAEEGLEQSFVIHASPGATGDLVVTGRLETHLIATARDANHGPVDFRDVQGRTILRYGAAQAFDAAGRIVPVTTAYRDGHLELSVPGDWLAAASWPVTIDPLMSRHTVSSLRVHSSLDVAHDATANQLMVVFARSASAADRDVFGVIKSDDYTLSRQVVADVTSFWSTPHVRVASSAGQKWCVVVERRFAPGSRAVRYHLRNSGDLTYSTAFSTFSPPLGAHDWRPDVGGVLPGFVVQPRFSIVFQQDASGLAFQNTANSRIVGRMIDASGSLGPALSIAASGLNDYERPSVNQQAVGGSLRQATHWMVAYQGYTNAGMVDDWDVFGRLIDSNSTLLTGIWLATDGASQPHHRMAPEIAGSSGRYLVVYTRSSLATVAFKTSLPQGHEVYAQRLDWLPNNNPVNSPERLQYTSALRQYQLGGCAYDRVTRSHWAFTVHSVRSVGGSGAVSYRRLGYRGIPTEAGVVQAAVSPAQGTAGGVTFDGDSDRFPLIWAMASSGNGTAYMNKLAYTRAFPIINYGLSCSSAQIAWSGSQQVGAELSSVRLSGAASGGLAILLVALVPSNMDLSGIGMPGCSLLVPNTGPGHVGIAVTVANSSGNASFGLPLPEFLHTDDLFFQWFHSAPGLNLANLATTRGLQVQIVR